MKNNYSALHNIAITLPLPARLAGLAADHLEDRGLLEKKSQ